MVRSFSVLGRKIFTRSLFFLFSLYPSALYRHQRGAVRVRVLPWHRPDINARAKMRQSKRMMGDSSRSDDGRGLYKLLSGTKMLRILRHLVSFFTYLCVLTHSSVCSEFDCDFEKPCAWTWEEDTGFIVISPSNVSQFQTGPSQQVSWTPKMDASNNTDGHYLLYDIDGSDSRKFVKIASPWLPQGSESHCFLDIWLHMYNMNKGTIKILIRSETNITSMADHFSGNSDNRWENYKKIMGRIRKPFQIIIEIEEGSQFPSHVAMDNLRLKHCVRETYIPCEPNHFQCQSTSCIDRNKVCDIQRDCPEGEDEEQSCDEIPKGARCTFEDGTCEWVSERRRDSEWTLHSGPTPVDRTGPTVDNTFKNVTGKYMWARFHPKRTQLGHLAVMNSAIFESPPLYHYAVQSNFYNTCQVRFFYHMYGSNMGELVLDLVEHDPGFQNGRKISLWRIYGDQENLWKRAVAPIPKIHYRFHLQFVATRGLRHRSDVAVDDVSLSPECFGIGVPTEELEKYRTTPSPRRSGSTGVSSLAKRYTFTSCGAKGSEGPTSSDCEKAYLRASTRVAVAADFPYKGSQMWTVPKSGVYTVFARGAGGGQGVKNRVSSRGTLLRAVFNWNAGEIIFFLIGQQGVSACRKV